MGLPLGLSGGTISLMNTETSFILLNAIAGFGWLLLMLAPYSRLTKKLVLSFVIPGILALGYLALLLIVVSQGIQPLDNSLMGIAELAGDPMIFVLGWAHVVCFDLVAGIWMTGDARARKIRHRRMILPYLLTFLAGPLGLLTYLVVRTPRAQKKVN